MIKLALIGAAGAGLFFAGIVLARSTHETPATPLAPVVTTASGRTFVAAPKVVSATPERDLHDPDPRVRAAAVADATDPQILLAASRDPSPEVGLRATDELGKLYAQGQLPASELISRIKDPSLDPKVRNIAMNGLGIVRTPEAGALLVESLAHGDPVERRTAAVLLMNQDAETAVPALITALADADTYVASNANEALHHLARGRDFGGDASAWRSWWQSRTVRP